MSKLRCHCGNTLNLSPHPNKAVFRLYSEPLLEEILEKIVEEERQTQSLQRFGKRVFDLMFCGKVRPFVLDECAKCGRLYIFRMPSDGTPALMYQPTELNEPIILLQDLERDQRAASE